MPVLVWSLLRSSVKVVSPSLRTTMSRLGYSLRAFSSQKVPCDPPSIVVACGCSCLAVSISFMADLYSRVVAVTPMASDGVRLMRSRKAS